MLIRITLIRIRIPLFHFDTDPDPTLHFWCRSDPTFHFKADQDLDPAPRQRDEDLQPLVNIIYPPHGSILCLHYPTVSVYDHQRLNSEPSQPLHFDFDANPNPKSFLCWYITSNQLSSSERYILIVQLMFQPSINHWTPKFLIFMFTIPARCLSFSFVTFQNWFQNGIRQISGALSWRPRRILCWLTSLWGGPPSQCGSPRYHHQTQSIVYVRNGINNK